MVGEIAERGRGAEFLSLKKHRRPGHQNEQRGHRPIASRRGRLMYSRSVAAVCELVVVLDEVDEGPRLGTARLRAPLLLLPRISLPLKEVAVLPRRHERLRAAVMVREIGFALARQRHTRAVTKVVVPQRVQTVAA